MGVGWGKVGVVRRGEEVGTGIDIKNKKRLFYTYIHTKDVRLEIISILLENPYALLMAEPSLQLLFCVFFTSINPSGKRFPLQLYT